MTFVLFLVSVVLGGISGYALGHTYGAIGLPLAFVVGYAIGGFFARLARDW